MDAKLLEVRDRATFIPVLAVLMASDSTAERYLLRRSGYAGAPELVMLTTLRGGDRAEYDSYAWAGRTFPVAHRWITEHWAELTSGDVVDVEFILGETPMPKASERLTV